MTSKSDRIRAYVAAHPQATGPEIKAALKRVSMPLIYQVLGRLKKRGRRGTGKNSPMISADALLDAKKLVNSVGSVEAARQALDVLAKLSL